MLKKELFVMVVQAASDQCYVKVGGLYAVASPLHVLEQS